MFKVIGERCGGLIDVDVITAKKTYLNYARLRFKDLKGGLIPDSLNIFCWGKHTKLKLFAL